MSVRDKERIEELEAEVVELESERAILEERERERTGGTGRTARSRRREARWGVPDAREQARGNKEHHRVKFS